MREPQGGVSAFPRDFPLRRAALCLGYLALVVAGAAMLSARDQTGIAFLLAGGLGIPLAHRHVYPVLTWLGVATFGVWLVIATANDAGLFVVLAAVGLAAIGARRESSARAVEAAGIAPPLPASEKHPVPAAVAPAAAPVAPAAHGVAVPDGLLKVNTIGRIQLLADGVDVTQELLGRKVLSFDWLYLLARAVLSEEFITRLELAAAVAPGVPNQKDRVRDQLRDMQRKLPPAVGQRIVVTKELVRFDATGCDWDVARLRDVKARCDEAGSLLPDELLDELQREVEAIPAGEFLPGWDHIEREVTEGRGDNDEVIRDARFAVDRLRADLTATLAANLRARGWAHRAIAPLEAERARSPEHPGIFQNLRKAYLETGQHEHAAALTRQYEAGEV